MTELINIGFGNLVNAGRLVALVSPDAAPVKRLIASAREGKRCVDATQGRKTKAVLIMDDDHIVLSALVPETIAKRISMKNTPGEWTAGNDERGVL